MNDEKKVLRFVIAEKDLNIHKIKILHLSIK